MVEINFAKITGKALIAIPDLIVPEPKATEGGLGESFPPEINFAKITGKALIVILDLFVIFAKSRGGGRYHIETLKYV